jgi:hypothetical protein
VSEDELEDVFDDQQQQQQQPQVKVRWLKGWLMQSLMIRLSRQIADK